MSVRAQQKDLGSIFSSLPPNALSGTVSFDPSSVAGAYLVIALPNYAGTGAAWIIKGAGSFRSIDTELSTKLHYALQQGAQFGLLARIDVQDVLICVGGTSPKAVFFRYSASSSNWITAAEFDLPGLPGSAEIVTSGLPNYYAAIGIPSTNQVFEFVCSPGGNWTMHSIAGLFGDEFGKAVAYDRADGSLCIASNVGVFLCTQRPCNGETIVSLKMSSDLRSRPIGVAREGNIVAFADTLENQITISNYTSGLWSSVLNITLPCYKPTAVSVSLYADLVLSCTNTSMGTVQAWALVTTTVPTTTQLSTTKPPRPPRKKPGLSGGVIAAVIIGGLVLLAVFGFGIYCICGSRNNNFGKSMPENPSCLESKSNDK